MKNLNTVVKSVRDEKFKRCEQISIGELIKQLRLALNTGDIEDKVSIRYDFGDFKPTRCHSRMPVSNGIAIGFSDNGIEKVCDFLNELQNSIGKTFTGYNGVDFVVNQDSPIFCAQYNHCEYSGIIGIRNAGDRLIILT
jgi:hypothetical protein